MSVVFYETQRSRKYKRDANGAALTRSWFCRGVTTPADAEALALLHNPLEFQGLFRQSTSCDPICADTWSVEVEYGIGSPNGFTPDNYSFKISGQTVHITQSKGTEYRMRPGDGLGAGAGGVGTAPDLGGAIGKTDEEVKGCDILVPSMQWSKSVQRASVDHIFLRDVMKLVGTVNDAEFYGYDRGTLLYLGCEPGTAQATLGNGAAVTVWNLTHTFLFSPNLLLQRVGGILIPRKKGHDYLWFTYAKSVAANQLNLTPDAAYVERVYDEADFTTLEIGTSDGGPGT